MKKYLIFHIFYCFLISNIFSYHYTLPGDYNWPKSSDFLELKKVIQGEVVFRGDSNYFPHTWNGRTNIPKPAVIIRPTTRTDVIEAFKFTRKFNIRLSVASTGHHQDIRNIYDNSVHLDMSLMNHKQINLTQKTLTVGPGNNFSQIHEYVAKESNRTLLTASGADPGVGIYGWTAGGGHGALTRLHGLGVDHVLSMDIVLANYTIVTVSETQHKELFRALRGSGGGTYGIVVSLTVRLFDSPGKMSTFGGFYELNEKTANLLSNWLINAPNEAFAYFLLFNLDKDKFVSVSANCFGNSSFCNKVLSYLKTDCTPVLDLNATCLPALDKYDSFYDFFKSSHSDRGGKVYLTSTAFNSSNILPGFKETISYLNDNKYTGCSANSVLGGFSSTLDTNRSNTAVSPDMRQGIMAITCFSIIFDSDSSNEIFKKIAVMDRLAENVFIKYSKWVYWNEPQHNFPRNDWKERYWGGIENYNRLLSVKKQYDPENIFTCYHCIGYENDIDSPAFCPVTSCSCSNTPDGKCADVSQIRWGNLTYKCDFNNDLCNGKIISNLNEQLVDLFETSNTASTSLGYDVTDLTSISQTTNGAKCNLPFNYKFKKDYNFCVKMQHDDYKCLTNNGYSNCKLGKYFGIKLIKPSQNFVTSWETISPILLEKNGQYQLEFNLFYNCYQKKFFLDFFSTDCRKIHDRFTIFIKYSLSETYSILKQIDLGKLNSVNNWQLNTIRFNTSSNNNLYLKIKFERISAGSKGEALFGLDELTVLNKNI